MGPRTKSLWMVAKGAHARGYPRPDGGLTLRDSVEVPKFETIPVAAAGVIVGSFAFTAKASYTTSWIQQWIKKYDQYRWIALTVVYTPTWGKAGNIISPQLAMSQSFAQNYIRPFIEFAYQIDYDDSNTQPANPAGWLIFIDNPRTVHIREWSKPVVIRYRPRPMMPIYRSAGEGGSVYVPVQSNPWLDTKALNIPHWGHKYMYSVPVNQFTSAGGLEFKIKYYYTLEVRTMIDQNTEVVNVDPMAGVEAHPMDTAPEPNEEET